MADTGLQVPTATGSISNQWSNPANAYSSDNVYATEATNGQKQDYGTFGFSIPSGAVIDGLEVVLEARSSAASFTPRNIQVDISWDGGSTWTSIKTTSELTTSDASYTLGGATDTWGRTWSDSEFSNANFLVRVSWNNSFWSYTCSLDLLQTRIHYTDVSRAIDTFDAVTIAENIQIERISTYELNLSGDVPEQGVHLY